jgi:hypothetical protein
VSISGINTNVMEPGKHGAPAHGSKFYVDSVSTDKIQNTRIQKES